MMFLLFSFILFHEFVNGRRRIEKIPINYEESLLSDDYYNTSSYLRRRLTKAKKIDHKVEKLPLFQGEMPVNYAGHLYVDGDHSAHFYWLFETPTQPENAPLIIWMNGGPGCSSMDGLFIELGPFKFENHKLVLNRYSWHKLGNLLFIDQPVGTGLSFTTRAKYPKNDLEVNIHLYKMLLEFLSLHENYLTDSGGKKMSREIYLTGESHAGHYIPSFTKYILEQNEKSDIRINIAGLAIGNGWMDPYNQYDVSDFMHALGALSLGQKYHMKQREKSCQALIKKGTLRSDVCLSLLDDVLASTGNAATGKIIMYDARISSRTHSYPPGHEEVESYLNRKDVRSALHVIAPQKYQECTDPPYFALAHQDAKGVTTELTYLLNLEMPILLFSGQFDVICNHLGTEKMLNKLVWNGRADWLRSTAGECDFLIFLNFAGVWAVDNSPAGFIRTAKNLKFLIVSNAGHMVPLSKPAESYDMMNRFLNKKPFAVASVKSTILSTMPPKEHISNDVTDSETTITIPREGMKLRLLSETYGREHDVQLVLTIRNLTISPNYLSISNQEAILEDKYSNYLLDLLLVELNMLLQDQFSLENMVVLRHLVLLPDISTSQSANNLSMKVWVLLSFNPDSSSNIDRFKELVAKNSLLSFETNILGTFILSKIDLLSLVIKE